MEPFKYSTIDLEGPAFRLIRLIKGNDDFIQCHLFDAWLHQPENTLDYAALSYTWGDSEKPYEIVVNGCRLPVTANLNVALRHLRRQDEDRILWIDAICINQDNHRERGHQVQQMASIYSEAERVIIWLGPSCHDTHLAMVCMKNLESESLKHACNDWESSDQRWMDIWSTVRAGFSDRLIEGYCNGLRSLLARSWFKRVWILQEVANARVAEVFCGSTSVSARIFALAPPLAGIEPDPHCQAVLDMISSPSRKASLWFKKRDLWTLLMKFGKSEASDPRDNIYALLGIALDASRSDYLKPDYEKSLQETIRKTTFFLLHFPESGFPTYGFPTWTLEEFVENLNCLDVKVLGWAAEKGYDVVVELLLLRGNIKIDANENMMALLTAAIRGHEPVVKLLVDYRQSIGTANGLGEKVLKKVVLEGHGRIAQLLVNHGADINAALYQAVSKESGTRIQSLVDSDACIGANYRETALMRAVSRESSTIIQLLIDRGIAINVQNLVDTALHQAISRESITMVQLLVYLGADINARNQRGETALHQAVFTRHNIMVQLLVDLGVDINAKRAEGETALDMAAHMELNTMVQLLIDKKAYVYLNDNRAITKRQRAVLLRNRLAVQLLRSYRARG